MIHLFTNIIFSLCSLNPLTKTQAPNKPQRDTKPSLTPQPFLSLFLPSPIYNIHHMSQHLSSYHQPNPTRLEPSSPYKFQQLIFKLRPSGFPVLGNAASNICVEDASSSILSLNLDLHERMCACIFVCACVCGRSFIHCFRGGS